MRYNDDKGPLNTVLGMSAIIACKNLMHYVMKRIGLVSTYELMDRIRKKLVEENKRDGRYVLEKVNSHLLGILSVDNLDKTNRNGLLVDSKQGHGFHLTAIREVFSLPHYVDAMRVMQSAADMTKRL